MGKTPTRAWRTRHTGVLTGVLSPLRAIFDELGEFLARPTFLNGIGIGDGSAPVKDPDTGVVTQPQVDVLDAPRLSALETGPIEGTRITDDSIESPKIKANAITAREMATWTLDVGQYIRSSNWQQGVGGWAIDANGDVEFNNGTFRGTVDAGDITSSRVAFKEYVQGSAHPDDADPYDNNAVVWTSPTNAAVARVKLQKTEGLPFTIFSSNGVQAYGGDFYQYGYLVVMPEDGVGGLQCLGGTGAYISGGVTAAQDISVGGNAHVQGKQWVDGFTHLGGATSVALKAHTYEGLTLDATGQVVFSTASQFSTAERRVMHVQAWEYESPGSVKPLGVIRASGSNIRLGTGAAGAKARCTVMYSENNMLAG